VHRPAANLTHTWLLLVAGALCLILPSVQELEVPWIARDHLISAWGLLSLDMPLRVILEICWVS
jgi:hypothetical protein